MSQQGWQEYLKLRDVLDEVAEIDPVEARELQAAIAAGASLKCPPGVSESLWFEVSGQMSDRKWRRHLRSQLVDMQARRTNGDEQPKPKGVTSGYEIGRDAAGITERERLVLAEMTRGLTQAQVATKLGLSRQRVSLVVKQLRDKGISI